LSDPEVHFMLFSKFKRELPTPADALPGRPERPFTVPTTHAVLGTPIEGPFPANLEVAYFGTGCFWGAEEIFWKMPGVWSTAVGYQGGVSPNPTYEEVCSGRTGHTEAVQVVYDPAKVTYQALLKAFWEQHDPTQGFRQGNDMGTQYRSAIYPTTEDQAVAAKASREVYAPLLREVGYGDITTEIVPAGPFYYAEEAHQQYLYKVPNGYRCHSASGITFPAQD
jgi:peptide-methionine (S)-S-oxide reductase